MKYVDYLCLTPKDQILFKINTYFKNFGYNFCHFWVRLGLWFLNFFKKIGRCFKNLGYAFKNGDIYTKISFIFLGVSHIRRGQITKGIIYLAVEALFIYYMVMFGASAIVGFCTLGTLNQGYACSGTENLFNIDFGVAIEDIRFQSSSAANTFCQLYTGSGYAVIAGDRSPIMLLFGILAIALLVIFICFYVSTVNASIKVQEMADDRIHLNNFVEDMKDYLDGKFYRVLLFLPVLGICIFTLLPIIDMILMAFTNYDLNHQEPKLFDWVGLDNFVRLFTQTGSGSFGYTFWHVLGWTLIWAFFATFINYFLGMFVAMIINKKGIRFKGLWRTLLVLSIAIPQFVSLMAINKFTTTGGLVEGIMMEMGILQNGETIAIWNNPTSARFWIIVINIWIGIPYTVLTVTGILMNIPDDLYESAQMDGTGVFRTYFRITLPYVIFVTGPSLISTFVGNINNFNVIFFLSGGGPKTLEYMSAGKTDLLVTWLYTLTVNQNNYSMGSVIGILVFVVCAIISLIVFRHTSGYKNEEAFA